MNANVVAVEFPPFVAVEVTTAGSVEDEVFSSQRDARIEIILIEKNNNFTMENVAQMEEIAGSHKGIGGTC